MDRSELVKALEELEHIADVIDSYPPFDSPTEKKEHDLIAGLKTVLTKLLRNYDAARIEAWKERTGQDIAARRA